MALPAVVAGAVSLLAAAIVADDLVTGGRVSDEIAKLAAQYVLDARGIPLDLDGPVNKETITAAINAAVMPDGVEFRNLFDSDMVKADVRRIALDYAAESFGFESGLSPAAIKAAITSEIVSEVRADIASGGGDYINAALGLVASQRLVDRPEPEPYNVPRVFSKKAAKNREYQAKYRESHKRIWI